MADSTTWLPVVASHELRAGENIVALCDVDEARAAAIAELSALLHRMQCDPALGRRIEEAGHEPLDDERDFIAPERPAELLALAVGQKAKNRVLAFHDSDFADVLHRAEFAFVHGPS